MTNVTSVVQENGASDITKSDAPFSYLSSHTARQQETPASGGDEDLRTLVYDFGDERVHASLGERGDGE